MIYRAQRIPCESRQRCGGQAQAMKATRPADRGLRLVQGIRSVVRGLAPRNRLALASVERQRSASIPRQPSRRHCWGLTRAATSEWCAHPLRRIQTKSERWLSLEQIFAQVHRFSSLGIGSPVARRPKADAREPPLLVDLRTTRSSARLVTSPSLPLHPFPPTCRDGRAG